MQTEVRELMKEEPVIIPGNTTLQEAAQRMKTVECGVLPVGNWDKPQGIITDRDIVIRAVAEGADVKKEEVRDYMTGEIFYCNENDTLAQAAEKMRKHHVTRLMVKDKSGTACGIITFGSIVRKNPSLKEIGKVVECAVGEKAA